MLLEISVDRFSGATTYVPLAASCSCTEGVSIAATPASWSFRMIVAGVALGTKKPNQVEASKSMPCS